MLVGHREVDVLYFRDLIENFLGHRVESVLGGFALMIGKGRQEQFANFAAQVGEGGARGRVSPTGAEGGGK